jgi:hypothetical protein
MSFTATERKPSTVVTAAIDAGTVTCRSVSSTIARGGRPPAASS